MVGFVLAAFFTGYTVRYASSSYTITLILFLIGDAIILLSGAMWLKILTGYDIGMAIKIGIVPFIPADVLKAAVAAAVYKNLCFKNHF